MQNPLEAYRKTQRELRDRFDSFTQENCPNCPTPCCRRPARILPTDILLAEATGWKAKILIPLELLPQEKEPEAETASEVAGYALSGLQKADETAEDLPCEFLGEKGCTFPQDLRPFGCTAFVCQYMYARLDRQSLNRLKRLVRELEERHTLLLKMLQPQKKRR